MISVKNSIFYQIMGCSVASSVADACLPALNASKVLQMRTRDGEYSVNTG
jgi:hypothetical protein